MRACLPFLSRISHSGCSCAIFETTYLCDSYLPSPSSTASGSHHNCARHALLVEVVGHLLDGVSGKRVAARIPVAIGIEPAIVKRRPLDAHFLQLRNRAQHLRRRDVQLISPAAPTHVVGFARRLGQSPSLLSAARSTRSAAAHRNRRRRRRQNCAAWNRFRPA